MNLTMMDLVKENEKLFKAVQELYNHRRQLRETLELFRKSGMCFCYRANVPIEKHDESCRLASKALDDTKS